VLVSLLSPEKSKPTHTQLLNAIMRAGGATPSSDGRSGGGSARRGLGLDAPADGSGATDAGGEVTSGEDHRRLRGGGGGASNVHVMSPSSKGSKSGGSGSGRESARIGGGGGGWTGMPWMAPILMAGGAGIAAALIAALVGRGGAGGQQGTRAGRGTPRSGPVHQGRW
jgi:hypothetical protein